MKAMLFVVAVVCACGTQTDVSESPASSEHGDKPCLSKVDVKLVEFSVTATPNTVHPGRVLFRAHNDNDDTIHELLVVRTDLTIAQLPTNDDGSFDEEGAGVDVLDEISEVPPHATRTLMLDLAAGHYVLLCNMVQTEPDGSIESHFAEGMHTDFNVK